MATIDTDAAPADTPTEYPHVVRRPGVVGGRARIARTRLPVWQVVLATRSGRSVAEVVAAHPGLTPAAVHSALAYAWDHADEVEAEIAAHGPARAVADQRRGPGLKEERSGVFRGRRPPTARTSGR